MPELAEVAFACSKWNCGLDKRVREAATLPTSRVYRDSDHTEFSNLLTGEKLIFAETHGKQMLFSFSGNIYLGIHLGMTGSLANEPATYEIQKYDALVLRQSECSLVFRDPRQFGRLRISCGTKPPPWWSDLPPSITENEFNLEIVEKAVNRHNRRPIKALLLDQNYFPGMGNWMADEVLWRAKLRPSRLAGTLDVHEIAYLYNQTLFVAKGAMKSVGIKGGDPPKGWLFHVRWKNGLLCPKTKLPLIRESIGGRTTCWSPSYQS